MRKKYLIRSVHFPAIKKQHILLYSKKQVQEVTKDNYNLLSGNKSTKCFTYKDAQQRWNSITESLNAMDRTRKGWKQ